MGTPKPRDRAAPPDPAGAAVSTTRAPARRRSADRRRPGQAPEGGFMTIVLIVLVIALAALAWVHFGPRIRRPSRVTATSPRRILFPFVAADLSAASARRGAAAGEGRGRDARTRLPGARAAAASARRAAAPPVRRGDPAARGDRAAGAAVRCSCRLAHRARPNQPPRAQPDDRQRAVRSDRDRRRRRRQPRIRRRTTSPGCSAPHRARSSCCDRARRSGSPRPRLAGGGRRARAATSTAPSARGPERTAGAT